MGPAKIVLFVLWVLCAACVVIDSNSTIVFAGRLTFWGMSIAHVAEFAMFAGVFKKAGGSMGNHFAKTLAFGLLHIREVRAEVEAS